MRYRVSLMVVLVVLSTLVVPQAAIAGIESTDNMEQIHSDPAQASAPNNTTSTTSTETTESSVETETETSTETETETPIEENETAAEATNEANNSTVDTSSSNTNPSTTTTTDIPTSDIDLRSISYGQTREGEISGDDPLRRAGGMRTDNETMYYDTTLYYEPVKFNGDAGDTVTISMEADNPSAVLFLEAPDGGTVAEDNIDQERIPSDTSVAEITFKLKSSGEYTIQAASESSKGYSLTLEAETSSSQTTNNTTGVTSSTTADVDEGGSNDNRTAANPISTNTTESINGELPTTSDIDWYSFEADAGQMVKIISGDTPEAEITVYNPDGEVVATPPSSETDRKSHGFEAAQTGTYYIKLSRSTELVDGQYHFSVHLLHADPFELNDGQENAVRIERNGQYSGMIAEGDQDWFAIDANVGEEINATISLENNFFAIGQDLQVGIYAPNGTQIGEFTSEASSNVNNETAFMRMRSTATETATASQSGTYYVRVAGAYEIGGFSRYNLRATTKDSNNPPSPVENKSNESNPPSPVENKSNQSDPNTGPESAVQITPPVLVNDTVSVSSVDWYKFEATAGQAIQIQGSTCYVTTELYGPNGEFVYTPSEEFTAEISDGCHSRSRGLVVEETGTYYIKVSNQHERPERVASYDFRLRITDNDRFEPNDNRDDAPRIQAGDNLSGTVIQGDVDWYAIDLKAGQRINSSIKLTPPNLVGESLSVDIFSPNGDQIGELPDEEPELTETNWGVQLEESARQTAVAEQTGTYYIRVRGDDADEGSGVGGFSRYSLAVSTTEEGSDDGPKPANKSGPSAKNDSDDGSKPVNRSQSSNDSKSPVANNSNNDNTNKDNNGLGTGGNASETADPSAEVIDLWIESGSFRPGDTHRGRVTVRNTGDSKREFIVSYDPFPQSNDVLDYDSTGERVTLQPSETRTIDLTWNVPLGAPTGAYTARGIIKINEDGRPERQLDERVALPNQFSVEAYQVDSESYTGGGNLEIERIETTEGDFEVSKFAPGQPVEVTVNYSLSGEDEYEIMIIDDDLPEGLVDGIDNLNFKKVTKDKGTFTIQISYDGLRRAKGNELPGSKVLELHAIELDLSKSFKSKDESVASDMEPLGFAGDKSTNIYVTASDTTKEGQQASVGVFGWGPKTESEFKINIRERDQFSKQTIKTVKIEESPNVHHFSASTNIVPSNYTGSFGDPPIEVDAVKANKSRNSRNIEEISIRAAKNSDSKKDVLSQMEDIRSSLGTFVSNSVDQVDNFISGIL